MLFLFKKLKRSVGYKTMGHFHQQDIAVNATMLATTIEIKEDGCRGEITVNTTMQHTGGALLTMLAERTGDSHRQDS